MLPWRRPNNIWGKCSRNVLPIVVLATEHNISFACFKSDNERMIQS
jgi:hypothetical protein